ncbi:hypothetical protein AALP_AA8G262000 [Arabis alpina]|uniref:Uncharacterized protein n=1 Tax=Arabis alpina TaxID=50452 RepID=A0A087G9I6_ARAAL|nr:hypothetical protein AALP_AA8G262000 [Arabis alpina]
MSSMARDQQKEQMVIQSSIVLLQERFRQLQRARELRAERELLNPKPQHQENILQYYSEPASFGFFQFLPLKSQTSSSQQLLSLSLSTSSASIEKPSFCHQWPSKDDKTMMGGFDRYDDVDTSLHL